MNATIKTTGKRQSTKRATKKRNLVQEIESAITEPQVKDVPQQTTELMKISEDVAKVGTYANNVLGLNALGRKSNTNLSYWIKDICELFKVETNEEVKVSINFEGCKVVTFLEERTNKETKEKFMQEVNITLDPIQEKLIKTIRRNSELYKVFEPLVRTTKKGAYNRFYTLQALRKNATLLQEKLTELLNK